MKKIKEIFILSFILNLIWENLHSFLYVNYKGGKITEIILLHASLGDAFIITLLLVPFLYISFFKKREWLIIIFGIIIAVLIEWYALSHMRWTYNEYMPIIPLINTGFTPTLQLGLLGYCVFKFIKRN